MTNRLGVLEKDFFIYTPSDLNHNVNLLFSNNSANSLLQERSQPYQNEADSFRLHVDPVTNLNTLKKVNEVELSIQVYKD